MVLAKGATDVVQACQGVSVNTWGAAEAESDPSAVAADPANGPTKTGGPLADVTQKSPVPAVETLAIMEFVARRALAPVLLPAVAEGAEAVEEESAGKKGGRDALLISVMAFSERASLFRENQFVCSSLRNTFDIHCTLI